MVANHHGTDEILDSQIINGRLHEDSLSHASSLAIKSGVFQTVPAGARTWGTVDASGGHIMPGLVTVVEGHLGEVLELCGKGVATALVPAGPIDEIESLTIPESVLDIVPIIGLRSDTTTADIKLAARRGIEVFDAEDSSPMAGAEALGNCTVRVSMDGRHLDDWVEAANANAFLLVITDITPENVAQAVDAKGSGEGTVFLELSSDVLALHNDSVWAAVLEGSVDICSMPTAESPGALPLLLEAVESRGLAFDRVAQLTSEAPARAARLSHRKGSLRTGMDADAVVVDARTPGVPHARGRRGHVNLSFRRGQFLYLQGEIHAKPTSGIKLHAGQEGDD